MNHRRRVDAIEAHFRPLHVDVFTDFQKVMYRGMETSPLERTVIQFAGDLAAMRYIAEGHFPPGARCDHVDDWREVTTADERNERIAVELERLIAFLREHDDPEEGLTRWTETATHEGWPRLDGPVYTIDRAGFDQLFEIYRSSGDAARLRDDPPATLWRREHPSWRPGMTVSEALREGL